ncbi:hypothetical protein OAS86_00040 [Gammaproteobacteria bacterium]|nr:hypothetical protein [Gammaproteobacteria bacterium]
MLWALSVLMFFIGVVSPLHGQSGARYFYLGTAGLLIAIIVDFKLIEKSFDSPALSMLLFVGSVILVFVIFYLSCQGMSDKNQEKMQSSKDNGRGKRLDDFFIAIERAKRSQPQHAVEIEDIAIRVRRVATTRLGSNMSSLFYGSLLSQLTEIFSDIAAEPVPPAVIRKVADNKLLSKIESSIGKASAEKIAIRLQVLDAIARGRLP